MRKFMFLMFVSALSLSCSNDDSKKESFSKDILEVNESAGKMHNDLVEILEKEEQEGRLVIDPSTKELTPQMIEIIDNYFLSKGANSNSFSDVLVKVSGVKENINTLIRMTDENQDLNVFLSGYNHALVPESVKGYSLRILDATLLNEGTEELSTSLKLIATEISRNERIIPFYREQLLHSVSIAMHSNDYWHSDELRISKIRYAHIAGADTAGALLMIQSGAVAAGAAFGGWGGLAVLVGGAAVSSFLASR
ncbi:hypothetical protein [Myroides sp. DW712]|uniref:hypothetical protein n=1 Tax=Myroides sp. DW712 TaxID=3389800 RepID=UPI00397C5FB8